MLARMLPPASSIRHLTSSVWWARRDSNPQPLPCKGSRLPLTYVPDFQKPIRLRSARRSVILSNAPERVKKALLTYIRNLYKRLIFIRN
jgi:hypothetical protein